MISAFASSLLTWIGDLTRTYTRSKREKAYLCIRVAVTLDAYALSCAEALKAAAAHYAQTKYPLGITLPEPLAYPADINWESIDPKLAYRLMSFLNECEALAAQARYAQHFENNPFDIEDAARSAGKKAYELANVVRRAANLSPSDLTRGLDGLIDAN